MILPAFIPGASGYQELRSEVRLLNQREAGSPEEVYLGDATRADGGRPRTESPSMKTLRQARGNEDVVVCDPPTRAKHSSAGSQHGELRAYSSEGVGVNNGVERRVAEGEEGSCGEGELAAPGQSELFGARKRGCHGRARYIGHDGPASASFGEVQSWPAASGTDIEEPRLGLQVQDLKEAFGLRHRGVPVCADDRANSILLHAIERLRPAGRVVLGEPLEYSPWRFPVIAVSVLWPNVRLKVSS
jgi:hypothetical protein